MPLAEQPTSIPGDFLERVTRWAQDQAAPVSVILFGSRARGDYGPESDWDVALVYDGECPSLDGLPGSIGDRDVDWSPIERSHAIRRLNVCSVPHAVAADGRCLHGVPLPMPERKDVNIPIAWDNLFEAHGEMRSGVRDVVDHWVQSREWRPHYNTAVARRSAMAGELLCKAVLSLRGVEPRRSHSGAELCKDLERACPTDPLLPVLRECDGLTKKAHVSVYGDVKLAREPVGVSARRLAAVVRAFGEVWTAVCDTSRADEGRDSMGRLVALGDRLREDVDWLCSSNCPADISQQVQAGLDAWPDTSELWDRLLAPSAGRTREGEDRGRGAPIGR